MIRTAREGVGFEIESSPVGQRQSEETETPFRIALLGNWSGRKNSLPVGARKPVLVDRDSFEAVLKKFDVRLNTPAGEWAIGELDDFHPDALYSRMPAFTALRETRERLGNPDLFAETARKLTGAANSPVPGKSSGNLLDDLISASDEGSAASRVETADELQRFVENAVRPILVARPDARAPELIRQVDQSAAVAMRGVLHSSAFRSSESSWRGLFQVVRRLETDTNLKLYLLDVTKEELATESSSLRDLLIERSDEWSLLIAGFAFGSDDTALLDSLAEIASKCEAPVIGEADLSLLSDDERWVKFRGTPQASWIGLALPRILLRLPYGEHTSSCETFDFEEVEGKPEPRQMLFGNPALFCAMLLAQSFEAEGWDMRPGSVNEVDKLPVFVYREESEPLAFPCAEIELTESTAQALLEAGIMPLAAIRGSDRVRILRFQSVHEPLMALPGRWI